MTDPLGVITATGNRKQETEKEKKRKKRTRNSCDAGLRRPRFIGAGIQIQHCRDLGRPKVFV